MWIAVNGATPEGLTSRDRAIADPVRQRWYEVSQFIKDELNARHVPVQDYGMDVPRDAVLQRFNRTVEVGEPIRRDPNARAAARGTTASSAGLRGSARASRRGRPRSSTAPGGRGTRRWPWSRGTAESTAIRTILFDAPHSGGLDGFVFDSPLEEDGFELPVPRLRNWRNSRRAGIFHFTDDRSSVLPFAAVASLPICRRRHEPANLSREQAGEFDRRRVLILRADDLQAHR